MRFLYAEKLELTATRREVIGVPLIARRSTKPMAGISRLISQREPARLIGVRRPGAPNRSQKLNTIELATQAERFARLSNVQQFNQA